MNAPAILRALQEQGVEAVALPDGGLRLNPAPSGELLEMAREHKAELLELLRSRGNVLPGPWPEIDQARRVLDGLVDVEGRLGIPVPASLEKAADAAFAARDLAGLRRVCEEAVSAMRLAAACKPLSVPAECPDCGAVLEPVMVAAAGRCSCGAQVLGEAVR